jgi:subtilase family serine protease
MAAIVTLQCSMASAVALADSGLSRVNGNVDDAERIVLGGHLSPKARPQLDAGAVPGSLAMSKMQLVFKRSSAQDQSLQALLADQQDKNSPRYHKWVSPTQFGAQFGASDRDIASASAWLRSQGFTVGAIPAGHGYLPFAGTAAQAQHAFQTELHFFNVNDEQHFAPVLDPSIPAALQDLVQAVAGLNDFHAKPNSSVRRGSVDPSFNTGNGGHLVVPADIATLYNFKPLYGYGITGTGVNVAIAAESDIDPNVARQYWSAVGVNHNQRLYSIAVPSNVGGTDPGQTNDGNETEAYLDVEIVGGLAPGAQIVLVRDTSARAAAQYAIEENIAPVLNISFGSCEHDLGSDGNAIVESAYQQAAAQGITVLVSSGDQGIATCDSSLGFKAGDAVVSGLSVNGLASTPYNVAVGGTDFNPIYAQNWAARNNSFSLSSAQSYIAEDVWNNSCANPIAVERYGAQSAFAFCNSQTAVEAGLNKIAGGGGGLSGCTVQTASGRCQSGYPQPAWQMGIYGSAAYGARAMPDVALLADNWLVCDQSVPCSPATGGDVILQGTSAAAPTMAAITALLDQIAGSQGNLNPLLYYFGGLDYGSPQQPNLLGLYLCSANFGAQVAPICVFRDVSAGSIAQPCNVDQYTGASGGSAPLGTCVYRTGDALGVVEINGVQVYAAASGYDLASGLGSLNATNFVAFSYYLEK